MFAKYVMKNIARAAFEPGDISALLPELLEEGAGVAGGGEVGMGRGGAQAP